MSRPASLERLRDISKQRSIRRPLLIPVPNDPVEDYGETRTTKVEWPVPIDGPRY
jgi:hypothetical protein